MYYYKYNFFCYKLNFKKLVAKLFFEECCDDILILKNPKIINLMKNKSSSNFLVNVDDILKTNEYVNNISSLKFDKKYKSSSSIDDKDLLKGKKTKNKVVKDKHKNNDVKNFVRSQETLFDHESIKRSNLKSRKASLRNKKTKLKLEKHNISIKSPNSNNRENNNDPLPKVLMLDGPISVQSLSSKINIHEAEIITYLFLKKSLSVTINQILDFDIALQVIEHYGFSLSEPSKDNFDNTNSILEIQDTDCISSRPPVITILGHVDHGKTTLLEAILKVSLVNKERGGITQSISGYEIVHRYNSQLYTLMFLDTPGHQSFKSMRLRGAKVTDIALLVIAVDDGVKPQTIECIQYIKEMSLSCLIVLTKSDKDINYVQKIKEDLANNGLLVDDWGGSTAFINVSAINGNNITNLLSKICDISSSMNLLANYKDRVCGIIIDSFIDKQQGSLTTLIVQNGTLNVGDIIASESCFGRVKSITNSFGKKISSAFPSYIVKVLCFSSPPNAGSTFYSFMSEKEAKKYCANYSISNENNFSLMSLNARVSSDSYISKKNLTLLIKADTQGSLEAIIDLLSELSQAKVQINVISASLGNITNNDVELANSTSASILAFNINALPQISISIKKYELNFQVFYVVYDLFEYVKNLMINLLDPEYNHVLIGNLNVQSIFNMNKGFVAGCVVTSGKVRFNSFIKVYRNNLVVHEGLIISLKQIKKDVEEVLAPNECGLMSDFQDWHESDLIEVYDTIMREKTL